MQVTLTSTFIRRYERKTPPQRDKVDKTLGLLASDTRHPSLRTHKVEGTADIFEAYVDDSMRMTFEYGQGGLVARNCCQHDAVLRSP